MAPVLFSLWARLFVKQKRTSFDADNKAKFELLYSVRPSASILMADQEKKVVVIYLVEEAIKNYSLITEVSVIGSPRMMRIALRPKWMVSKLIVN